MLQDLVIEIIAVIMECSDATLRVNGRMQFRQPLVCMNSAEEPTIRTRVEYSSAIRAVVVKPIECNMNSYNGGGGGEVKNRFKMDLADVHVSQRVRDRADQSELEPVLVT